MTPYDEPADDRLSHAMEALRTADLQRPLPRHLERRVVALVGALPGDARDRAPASTRRRAAVARRLAWGLPAAAALAAIAVSAGWRVAAPARDAVPSMAPPVQARLESPTPVLVEAAAPVVARAPRRPRDAPASQRQERPAPPPVEPLQLVRVRMSQSDLVLLGVPVADADPSRRVDVELVVGLDGAPVGLRRIQLVAPSVP